MALTIKKLPAPAVKKVAPKKIKDMTPNQILISAAGKEGKTGHVRKGVLKEAAKNIQRKKEADTEAFIKLVRANAHKTDEELMEELAPHLKRIENPKGGRKPDPEGNNNSYNEKVLLAWRLKQRGLTHAHVAQNMQVSVPMVCKYMASARDLLRVDPSTIDIPQQVGETLSLYTDLKEMALMIASSKTSTPAQKLNAIRTVASIESDRTDYLSRVGVYSPSVMQHFQSLMMNQFIIPSNDAKEVGMEQFFSQMANDLMQATAAKKLQSIANGDAEEVEFKNA